MTTDQRIRIHQELEMLLADYWHDVDVNFGRNAADFYEEDAVFHSQYVRHEGREQIRKFYQFRRDRGARTAVHVATNFRVESFTETEAVTTWYMQLFAHDGTPVHPTAPPIQIAFMTDVCRRQPDGRWLYKERKFDILFEGGVPTTRAPKPGA